MIDYLLSLVREGKLTYEYVSVHFGLAFILSFREKWTNACDDSRILEIVYVKVFEQCIHGYSL